MKKYLVFFLAVVTLLCVGCKKDDEPDIILKDSSITLHYGETYQIELVSGSDVQYETEDTYHAIVDETGLVTGVCVGETNIRVFNGNSSTVLHINIIPKSNMYREPDIVFGESKKAVIARYGTPSSTTSSGISYTNYPNAKMFMVVLENDKVTAYGLAFGLSYATELPIFLRERYIYVGESDSGILMLCNNTVPDKVTMVVGLQVTSPNLIVSYSPYTKKTQNVRQQLESLLKE